MPLPDPKTEWVERIVLNGDVPRTIDRPTDCHFHTRCPYVMNRCRQVKPVIRKVADGRSVACHLHEDGHQSLGHAHYMHHRHSPYGDYRITERCWVRCESTVTTCRWCKQALWVLSCSNAKTDKASNCTTTNHKPVKMFANLFVYYIFDVLPRTFFSTIQFQRRVLPKTSFRVACLECEIWSKNRPCF